MVNRLTMLGAGAVSAAIVLGTPLVANAQDRSHPGGIVQSNLISNRRGMAKVIDRNVINSWGISDGPESSVWVSEQGSGTATVVRGDVPGQQLREVKPTIKVPGAGGPTGQVFNDTSGFTVPRTKDPARFIFVGVSGNVTAWNQDLKDSAVEVTHTDKASYTGVALIHGHSGPELAAADAANNKIDLYDSGFHKISLGGKFHDPRLPREANVFNIQSVGGSVFVAYSNGDPYAPPAAGANKVLGWIDQYRTDGSLLRRFATGGALDNPWAITVAPRGFGKFAGKLLIGNFSNGRINVYDPRSGHYIDVLRNTKGQPLAIDGLWGLVPGSKNAGGTDKIWFAAGPNKLNDGLIGTLSAA